MVDRGIKLAMLHGPDAPKGVLYEDFRKAHKELNVDLMTPEIFQLVASLGTLTRQALHGLLRLVAVQLATIGWTILWDGGRNDDFGLELL